MTGCCARTIRSFVVFDLFGGYKLLRWLVDPSAVVILVDLVNAASFMCIPDETVPRLAGLER